MKKIIIAGLVLLIVMLGACGALSGTGGNANEPVELSRDFDTADGNFTISVPENWMKDYSFTQEEMIADDMVLILTDNNQCFLTIYFYDNNLYDYPLNFLLQDNLDYYGDKIIGDYEELKFDDMDMYMYEYSLVDFSMDNEEFNYHGYEYMINTPYGVVDIDIYYAQEKLASKVFTLSESQLLLLKQIAESFQVN